MCYLVFVFLSGLTVFMLLIGSLLVRVMLDMPVFAGMNPCQLASENLHLLVLFLFCDLNHCSPSQDISYTNYEYTQYYLPYFSSYDCQAIYYMQLSFFDQDLQFQMQSNSYYFFIQDPENLLSICDSFWMMNVSEQPAFIIQSQQTKYQQQNTDYQYIVNYQAHLSYLIVQYSNAAKIVNLSCILPNVFVSIMKQSDKHNIKALSYAKSDVGYYKVNLKSQVWRHFKRNLAGQCRCNYCGMLFKQLHHSTNQMSAHLNKQHSVQIYGYNHPKREQEEFMTDLIQNLFIDGYPIDKIVDNLLKLFTSHGQQFEGLLQRFVGQLASKKQRIKQILEILPIDTDKRVIEQMITQFLPDLSKSARKCLLEQYFWIYSNQEQIILNFKEHGYDIINLYDNQNLNLMMLVTDSMKYMYQKYGDSLSIDLIDKVFKKKSPYGFSQYSTWFFTGQNQQLENVLFGFAIINEENQRNLEFMFDRFFKRMDYMYPISACIPPLTILQTHLQKHTPSTTLTTNWYHKLKFLSSSLQNQFPQQKQSIMSTICNCFRTQSYEQYKYLLHKIMSKISDQNVIKYSIQKCTQYCCIFNIPSTFIGFSIQTWKYVQLESAVRQIFVYQDNLARVFIYVAKLDRNLNYAAFRELQQNYDSVFPSSIMDSNNCKKQPYQQLTPNHPSSPIPLPHPPTLSPNLLKRLELSIQELGTYKLQIIDPITVRIQSKKNHISKWKIYTICFNIQSDIWVCNCKYLFHTGIPCGHLIKVIEYFHGDYMWYVNSRWLG